MVGAAAATGSARDTVVITKIEPTQSLTGVYVTAFRANGLPGFWSVTAFATCATPPPGLELVTAYGAFSSVNKGATATCPAGKTLLGTGARCPRTTRRSCSTTSARTRCSRA